MSASGGKPRIILSQLPTGLESQADPVLKAEWRVNAPAERDVQTASWRRLCNLQGFWFPEAFGFIEKSKGQPQTRKGIFSGCE